MTDKNLPARLGDAVHNPFAAIVTVGITLIAAIVVIARRAHK